MIEAVDRLPLASFRVNHRGTGDRQFPPYMMLALLIYSYANGLFSSRKIERATYREDRNRFYYLCGPPEMVEDLVEALDELGIDESQIVTEDGFG